MSRSFLHVISSKGFGFLRGLLTPAKKTPIEGRAIGQANINVFLNAMTGNALIQDHCKSIKDGAFQLSLGLTYNTKDSTWRMNHPTSLKIMKGSPTKFRLIHADGSEFDMILDGVRQAYIVKGYPGSEPELTLTNDGNFSLWYPDTGFIEIYNEKGLQQATNAPDGSTLNFRYENDMLSEIQGPFGDIYHFERGENTLTLKHSSATNNPETVMTYNLNKKGQVTKTRILLQKNKYYDITYDYDAQTQDLIRISQNDGTELALEYKLQNGESVLQKISDGEGRFEQMSYSSNTTEIRNNLEQLITVTSDSKGRTEQVSQSYGKSSIETNYHYNEHGQCDEISHLDKNTNNKTSKKYKYAGLGLCQSEINEVNASVDFHHDSKTGVLLAKIDYLNGTPLKTHYIYNNKQQLCFEVSPRGCVTAYDYNVQGFQNQKRVYLANAFNVAFISEETPKKNVDTLKQWCQVQPLSEQALTEYPKYNLHGYCERQIDYAKVDEKGNGIADGSEKCTDFEWNLYGQLLCQKEYVDEKNILETHFRYDGLQRLTSSTDASGHFIKHTYDGQSHEVIDALMGKTSTTLFDKGGLTVAIKEVAGEIVRVTRYQRDEVGHIREIQHPNKTCQYQWHDEEGRLLYEISPSKRLTCYRYTSRGQLTEKVTYSKECDFNSALISLKNSELEVFSNMLSKEKKKQDSWFYDAAGQLCFYINPEHVIEAHRYDTLGQETCVITYDTRWLSTRERQEVWSGVVTNIKDRHFYSFYDEDGAIIATQDGDRYFIEYVRQIDGALSEVITRAAQVPSGIYKIKPSKDDTSELFFRNRRGECEFHIDAEQNVTETKRNRLGLEAKVIRYLNPIFDVKTPATLKLIVDKEDQVIEYEFDQLKRKKTMTTSDQIQIQWKYDSANHLIDERKIDLQNPTQQERRLWRYDGFGQLVAELNVRMAAEVTAIEDNGVLSNEEKQKRIQHIWATQSTRYAYDAPGLRLSKIDSLQHKTFYYYNELEQPILTVYPKGAVVQTVYDDLCGKPQSIRQYYTNLSKKELTSLRGGVIDLVLKSRLMQLEDEKRNRVETFEYNLNGLLILSKDGEDYITRKEYNSFDEVDTTWQPLSKTTFIKTTHLYNQRGLEELTIQDAEGLKLSVKKVYNFLRKCESVTDARQHSIAFKYDRLGRVCEKSQQVKLNALLPAETITEITKWNSFSQKEWQLDPFKRRTTFTYQQKERTQLVVFPNQRFLKTQHNAFEQPIEIAEGKGFNVLSTSFQYDRGGLLSRERDENKRENFYTYDTENLKTEQSVSGVKTNYVYDEGKCLVRQISGSSKKRYQTHIVNNSFGEMVEQTDSNGYVKAFIRDNRGLICTSVIDPNNLKLTTTWVFNGLGTALTKTVGDATNLNQYDEFYLLDTANRYCGLIVDPKKPNLNVLALKKEMILDANGNVIITLDPLGRKTFHYIDERNDERLRITPNGKVTEWGVDALGRQIFQRVYGKPFPNIQAMKTLSRSDWTAFVKENADNKGNSCHYYYYNDADECCFTVNPNGSVTEKQYDDFGHEVGIIEHAFRVDIQKQPLKSMAEFVVSIQDLISLEHQNLLLEPSYSRPKESLRKQPINIYRPTIGLVDAKDAPLSLMKRKAVFKVYQAKDLRFIINGEGQVTELCYDERGNRIATIQYIDRLKNLIRAPKTSAEIMKLIDVSKGSRTTQFVFDDFNREVYHITQSGIVTVKEWDGEENLLSERRYKKRVDVKSFNGKITEDILAKMLDGLRDIKDRFIQQCNDAANRSFKTIYNEVDTEERTFDAMDNILTFKDKEGETWETVYDRAGRKIKEYTPKVALPLVKQDKTTGVLSVPETLTQTLRILTQTDYDAASNIIAITEGKGLVQERTIHFYYDNMNQKTGSSQPEVPVDSPELIPTPLSLPIIKKELKTRVFFNLFGQELVEINEAGALHFRIFTDAGDLHYEINTMGVITEYVRDNFNQVIYLVVYDNPVQRDLTAYIYNGLTEADLLNEGFIQPSSFDRIILTHFNSCGEKLMVLQSSKMMYLPEINNQIKPGYGFASPCTIWSRNGYNEVVQIKTLINPFKDKWEIERQWYDEEGHVCASLNANQFFTIQLHDVDGLMVLKREFLLAYSLPVNESTLFSDIIKSLEDQQSKSNITEWDYSPYRYLLSVTKRNRVYQHIEFEKEIPVLKELAEQSYVTTYKRSPSGRLLIETKPDGAKRYQSWDARGLLVAKADWPKVNKEGNAVHPFTMYAYGIDAQVVRTLQFAKGIAIKNDTISVPSVTPGKDREHIVLHDIRGLPTITQDANQNRNYQTYNAARGQEAREYRWVHSEWKQTGLERNLIFHLIQTMLTYDGLGRTLSSITQSSDGNKVETYFKYNTFGEKIAEGPTPSADLLYWLYDATGYMWNTNENKGIPTLQLSDGNNQKTLTLTSKEDNLAQITETDLYSLLAQDYLEPIALKTKGVMAKRNQGIATPSMIPFKKDKPSVTDNISWTMQDDTHLILEGNNLSEVRGIELIQEGKSVGRVSITHTDSPNKLLIHLSDMPSGTYEFSLLYGPIFTVDDSIKVGTMSAKGTQLNLIQTEVNQDVKISMLVNDEDLNENQPHIKVKTTWKNLPPFVSKLQNKISVTTLETSSDVSPFIFFENQEQITTVASDKNGGEITFKQSMSFNVDEHKTKGFGDYSLVISQNQLIATDDFGKTWVVADVVNSQEKTVRIPPYLYLKPSSHGGNIDAIVERLPDGKKGKIYKLDRWIHGTLRVANVSNCTTFDTISLVDCFSNHKILGKIHIHSRDSQPKTLMAREIPLKNVTCSKVITYASPNPITEMNTQTLRPSFNIHWELPEGLNRNPLETALDVIFPADNWTTNAVKECYGESYQFNYQIGRSYQGASNGPVMPFFELNKAENLSIIDQFNLYELKHLKVSVKIGEDSIPLLDASSISKLTNVHKKSFTSSTDLTWGVASLQPPEVYVPYVEDSDYLEGFTASFADTSTMLLSPLPANVATFELEIGIKPLSGSAILWTKAEGAVFTGHGIAFPVTQIVSGMYQYRLKAWNKQGVKIDLSSLGLQFGGGDNNNNNHAWMLGEMAIKHGKTSLKKDVLSQPVAQNLFTESTKKWNFENIQQTEYIHDVTVKEDASVTREIQRLPAYQGNLNEPDYLSISLSLGQSNGQYFISWPAPDEKILETEFTLWPKGETQEGHNSLKVIKDTRWKVNVTDFATDDYCFQINYFAKHPVTGQLEAFPRYCSRGTIPVITAKNGSNKNILWYMPDDAHIILAGNVSDVKGVELLEEGKPIRRVSVTSTDSPNKWIIDLTDQVSGRYDFRLLYGQLLMSEKPIQVGVTSENGTKLSVIKTEISQEVTYNFIQYGPDQVNDNRNSINVRTSWKNLPPKLDYVYNTITAVKTYAPGNSTQAYVEFPSETKVSDKLSVNLTMTELNFENIFNADWPVGKHWGFGRFSFVVSQNKLYSLDRNGREWSIAQVLSSIESPDINIPYLYVEPGKNMSEIDAIIEYFPDGKTGKTYQLSEWIDDAKRLANPPALNKCNQYQPISLASCTSSENILGTVIIHTANIRLTGKHLIAREIPLTNVSCSKVLARFKGTTGVDENDWWAGTLFGWFCAGRPAFNVKWQLPPDLNSTLLDANLNIYFKNTESSDFDRNLTLVYGNSHEFNYKIGKSYQSVNNCAALPANPLIDDDRFHDLFKIDTLKLKVIIGGDYIPLMDATYLNITSGFTNKTPSCHVNGGESRYRYNVAYSVEGDTATFANTYTMWLYPLPNNIKLFNMQYRVNHLVGIAPTWVDVAKAVYTGHGLAFPVTALTPGIYQYRLWAKDAQGHYIDLSALGSQWQEENNPNGPVWTVGEMWIKRGEQLLVQSIPYNKQVIRPERSQTLDYHRNVLSSTNTLGNTFNQEVNLDDQMIKIIKPEITVTTEANEQNRVRPTTVIARNSDGVEIGVKDANNHVTAFVRDQGNTLLKTVKPTGSSKLYRNNMFGLPEAIRDAFGHEDTFTYDNKGAILEHIDAKTLKTKVIVNEIGQRISSTNPKGETEQYGYTLTCKHPTQKITRNILSRFALHLQTGLVAEEVMLFQGKILKNIWKRNHFGLTQQYIESIIDKQIESKKVINFLYNHNQQLTSQQQEKDANTKSAQHIVYLYDEAGYLVAMIDIGLGGLETRYRYDTDGRRTRELFTANDGHLHQATLCRWNEAGQLIEVQDTLIKAEYGLDSVGNRRVTKASIYWNGGWCKLAYQKWYTYNAANQREMSQGKFNENTKTIVKDPDGSFIQYDKRGWIETEKTVDNTGKETVKSYLYYDNGLLWKIFTNGVETSVRVYDDADRCITLITTEPGKNPKKQTNVYDSETGWLMNQTIEQKQEGTNYPTILETAYDYATDNPGALVVTQTTRYMVGSSSYGHGYTDKISTEYILGIPPKISTISGTRTPFSNDGSKYEPVPPASITLQYDVNGNVNKVTGALEGTGFYRDLMVNGEGRIVEKRQSDGLVEYYFYDSANHLLGHFGDIPPKSFLKALKEPEPPKDMNFDLTTKKTDEGFPLMLPEKYIAEQGDTWESIAEMFQQGSNSDEIARANCSNPSESVLPGQSIMIPNRASSMLSPNQEGIYAPYNAMEIIGSLNLKLDMPRFYQVPHRRHRSFWHELAMIAEIAVGVAILAFAPELATVLASAMPGVFALGMSAEGIILGNTFAYAVAGGILGAASSIAEQSMNIALGNQSGINWKSIGESALYTALTAGIEDKVGLQSELKSLNKNFQWNRFARVLEKNEVVSLVRQAVLLTTGQQRKPNWSDLAITALGSASNSAMDTAFHSLGNATSIAMIREIAKGEIQEAFSADIYHRKFSAENAAAQALGTILGQGLKEQTKSAFTIRQREKPINRVIPQKTTRQEKAVKHDVPKTTPKPHRASKLTAVGPHQSLALDSDYDKDVREFNTFFGKAKRRYDNFVSENALKQRLEASPSVRAQHSVAYSVVTRILKNNPRVLAYFQHHHKALESSNKIFHKINSNRWVSGVYEESMTLQKDLHEGRYGRVVWDITEPMAEGMITGGALNVTARAATPIIKSIGVSVLKRIGVFGKGVGEGRTILRQRVISNITESAGARDVSNFRILTAKEDQLLSGYNLDNWTMTTLKKGDMVYGGLPGQSNYYTTFDSVFASGGNKDILGQFLQVNSHVKFGYRPNIGEYVLTKDVRVPTGIVGANPHLGVGNSTQFFINKNLNMLRLNNEYSLEKFYEFNMSRNQYSY